MKRVKTETKKKLKNKTAAVQFTEMNIRPKETMRISIKKKHRAFMTPAAKSLKLRFLSPASQEFFTVPFEVVLCKKASSQSSAALLCFALEFLSIHAWDFSSSNSSCLDPMSFFFSFCWSHGFEILQICTSVFPARRIVTCESNRIESSGTGVGFLTG